MRLVYLENMPRITKTDQEIYNRTSQIQEMLRPLFFRKEKSGPACAYRPGSNKTLIFAAHQEHPGEDFREWRFNLTCQGYLGGYYEIWQPTNYEKLDKYYLDRAYLTIYHFSDEYISLHCDPEEPDGNSSKAYQYKRLPHLHLHRSEYPIPKSHIAIGYGFSEQILSSNENLFKAISNSIELICDEILTRL